VGVSQTTTLDDVSPVMGVAARAVAAPDFARLYEHEFSYVWHTVRRLGVAARDLPDVTHDVFVTVYRRLDTYDSARPLRPWLFGVAYRTAADHHKRARTAREVVDDQIEVHDPAPGAEQRLADAQTRQLVQQCLAALELDRRAVLIMHDIDGHAMPEIAAALGVPLKTMYSRLRLAREDFTAAVRRQKARRGEP
jgi:RNA polymerase sigma-70 factor (ECF subfamily)